MGNVPHNRGCGELVGKAFLLVLVSLGCGVATATVVFFS